MKKKIIFAVIYPPGILPHAETKLEFQVNPDRAIELIRKYKGWFVIVETPSGKKSLTDISEIKHATSIILYYPASGG